MFLVTVLAITFAVSRNVITQFSAVSAGYSGSVSSNVLVRCMFAPVRVSGLVGYNFVVEVARKYFVEEGLARHYGMQRFSIFLLRALPRY